MSDQKCEKCGKAIVPSLRVPDYMVCEGCQAHSSRCECIPTGTESLRRIKLTPASDIEPEPVIWAWEDGPDRGRIPAGALTLAAGREGTGKSSFGIWLAAQLSRGELPGTFHGHPKAVFYCAVEDSWSRTLVPRLIAAGADMSRVYRVEVEDVRFGEVMVSLPADVELIEKAIAEYDAAALIVDPIMSTLGSGTDAHRTQDVRRALEPLVRMAERTKALTLGIMHFSKASGTDASQLISGSGAFKDLARAILAFARDRETDEQVMTQTKNSLGRLDLPSLGYRIDSVDIDTRKGKANVGRLEFTGESERSVEDTLVSRDPGETSERGEASAWIRDYLTHCGGSALAKDVIEAAKHADFKEDPIRKARAKVATTKRSGFGKGSTVTWSLIDSPIDAIDASSRGVASMASMAAPMESESATSHMWWPGRSTGEHGRDCTDCRQAPGGPDHAQEAGQ
ncbi:AAA family ATPase [Glycomyces sp. L485]|uniref:AAA family ATPase n=1 Tax=Glycomyces sp. L485 TaxID=2909235 RepID=UPI001F4A8C71|nr:AAA family ATPase [Glycomyces sp. L485]MCH7231166.1 AAA family ATPase [Glycomyces sp. L485]